MATRVNYGDNLFFATTVVRTLRSGLKLEIDADYFLDKIVEDVFFVDTILQQIYESLRVNTYLINRKDHLHELMRAKRNFADLLNEILENDIHLKEQLDAFAPKFRDSLERHVNDIADIQNAMDSPEAEVDTQSIVSQDEFRFLLEGDAEPE